MTVNSNKVTSKLVNRRHRLDYDDATTIMELYPQPNEQATTKSLLVPPQPPRVRRFTLPPRPDRPSTIKTIFIPPQPPTMRQNDAPPPPRGIERDSSGQIIFSGDGPKGKSQNITVLIKYMLLKMVGEYRIAENRYHLIPFL